MTAEEKQAKIDEQKKIHEAAITGKGLELLPPAVRRSIDNPEFQGLLATDPAKLVQAVRQPLLIVQGGLRYASGAAERRPVSRRPRTSARMRRRPSVVKVPEVNHLLVPATTGEVGEYGDPQRQACRRQCHRGDRRHG